MYFRQAFLEYDFPPLLENRTMGFNNEYGLSSVGDGSKYLVHLNNLVS